MSGYSWFWIGWVAGGLFMAGWLNFWHWHDERKRERTQ